MEYLSIEQIFGKNAKQSATTLIINKADLNSLTPSDNNSAESLLVGILLTAYANFQGTITDENSQPITDENRLVIFYDNSEGFELLKIMLWQPFVANRNNRMYITNQIIIFNYAKNQ